MLWLWVYRFGTLLLLSYTIPVSGSTSKTARARVYLHVAGVPTQQRRRRLVLANSGIHYSSLLVLCCDLQVSFLSIIQSISS